MQQKMQEVDELEKMCTTATEKESRMSAAALEQESRVEGLSKLLNAARTERLDMSHDLEQGKREVTDLKARIAMYEDRVRQTSESQNASNKTTAKRTSTIAFPPEEDVVISNKVHRRNSGTLRGPIDGAGPDDPSPIIPVSYPEDIASVGCMRINISEVTEERWEESVSDDLRELVRNHLKWSASRSKNFAVPKKHSLDVSEMQCLWHSIARSKTDKACLWHDAEGRDDVHHACKSCQDRMTLCSILEKESVLVSLPLHPSARQDKDQTPTPRDRSYWVNDS